MSMADPKTVREIARANAAEVANELRAERIRQNLTQGELGLGTSVICSWKTGRSAPGLRNLTRWAATLGLEITARRPDEQPQDCPCPRCKYGTDKHRENCERAGYAEQPQDVPLSAAELAELAASIEHLSGPDAWNEARLEAALIPVTHYVPRLLAMVTQEQPRDEQDMKTCAHCQRDLTGASVHTIQGIDVCADIRACLARQSRFVERIVELDQLKAQDKRCPECGASGYLWRPDDRECEVCVAVADVENAIDDLAEKVEQQQADPDIRHLTVQTKQIVAHMSDLAQENATLRSRQPQDERDGDVRAVAATLRWIRAEIAPERKLLGAVQSGAWMDLEDRFMDRIAVLEAHDARIKAEPTLEAVADVLAAAVVQIRTAGTAPHTQQADREQLRPEYGIRAAWTNGLNSEGPVAETLDGARKALEEFDARYGERVVSRELVERPVGDWRKVKDER